MTYSKASAMRFIRWENFSILNVKYLIIFFKMYTVCLLFFSEMADESIATHGSRQPC